MKNNKMIGLTLAVALSAVSVLNVSAVFAATTTTTTNQEQPQKPENEIIGKITAIDASSVTIAVATRKEMEKPTEMTNNGGTGTPPEKPSNDGTTGTTGTNGNPPEKPSGNPPEKPSGDSTEKPNMDNMFTLTGETKTINIASAEFGGGHMMKPKDDGTTTTTTTTTETQKTETYADYAVGDYISIELTDSTSLVAKTVRNAGFGGGPGNGSQPNGQPPEKNQ